MFDYGFLGGEDHEVHVVPRKGMVHEHGDAAMVSDIERLGCKEIILKCDGEPAMKSGSDDPGKLSHRI